MASQPIDCEELWRAIRRLEQATEQAQRQADRLEDVQQKLAYLLDPGYGGTLSQLLQRLENQDGI